MLNRTFAVMLALVAVLWAPAGAGASDASKKKGGADDAAHVKKDVGNHRAMADAHLNAAKCLESGKSEKECHAQLEKDCRGLGIGKYCGMKHRH